MCQLESSGKWPDELIAVAKIKSSFYTYISEALKQQHRLLSSPTEDHLDILKVGTGYGSNYVLEKVSMSLSHRMVLCLGW